MKKIAKYSLLLLVLTFIAIQFKRPDRTPPSAQKENDLIQIYQPPLEIAKLIRNACYDCHSYETAYPWYAEIAPFSWLIDEHVYFGREELNFSEWKKHPPNDQSELLLHCGRVVKRGQMPLSGYMRFHPEARLTEDEKEQLISWFQKKALL